MGTYLHLRSKNPRLEKVRLKLLRLEVKERKDKGLNGNLKNASSYTKRTR